MRRRRKRVGCTVEVHNGRLRVRFAWQGRKYARQTMLPDTPDNRRGVEKLALLVGAHIATGKNPLALFERKEKQPEKPRALTIAEYFDRWIVDKNPPLIRKAQARDYRRHIRNYVLPRLGDIAIAEVSARDILGAVGGLLHGGLSVKFVKNIFASFRAMIRDAREIDQLLTRDPFGGIRWPKASVPGPDPFSADERRRILGWFQGARFGVHCGRAVDGPRRRVHPPYHAYAHTLFWTGMRPSEAAGLKWSDVDLNAGILRIVRSRHMYQDSAPKTGQAMRTVELLDETIRILRAIQPLHVAPATYVFTSTIGTPIEPKVFSAHFYRCLRGLGIRIRGIYATKDTYISTALTAGVNTVWLEAQTGVRYETMRRHYGKWLRAEGADQLRKLIAKVPAFSAEDRSEDVQKVSLRVGQSVAKNVS